MEYILIVDDSKIVCNTLERLIREQLGYEPVVAYSKEECEQKLLQYKDKISVALLDLHLPDALEGEVVDVVGQFNIPSIVLTASVDKEDLFRGKDIVDYVIKDSNFAFGYILKLVKRIVSNRSLNVLVTGDSKISLENTTKLLKRYQINCLSANDGKEALEVLKNNKDIKIIFTEYSMKNMDGLELTRNIRKQYTKDELSIMLIAGNRDRNIVAKFLKYGGSDFLYKGFSDEEFYARLNSDLETLDLFEDIKNKANKDYLTSMYNRRYFFDQGEKEYKKALKKQKSICVAMFDIDKFKNINDTYGHDIGDIAIQEVAKVLHKYFEDDAIVSRFGGEEFCVLQVCKSKDEFYIILENIRKEFETNIIPTNKGDISYTVSVGYSTTIKEELNDMVIDADKALYTAKQNGRNQVRSIYES
ncbi:MAG: diguanylate cyclase [Campylobacterota bacterium]|nr:diguanylate cyclase [Campylobacterota bacterium]